jgi:ATP-dependent Clp protease ATP-binding subunit ClpA
MFERFSDRARRVLVLAQEEARLLNHSFIGTEHLLLGLIAENDGVAAHALAAMGITLERVRERVEETIGLSARGSEGGQAPFTPRAKKVLELSLREALQLGHNYIGTEHILLGIVREGEGVGAQVLQSLGADLPRVRRQVTGLLVDTAAIGDAAAPVSITVPRCPQCHTELRGAIRFRHLEVEPEDETMQDETMPVDVVFCSRCGTTVGVFRTDA